MRMIWQSLAWKEWHEHKWRMAALSLILSVLAIVSFGNSDDPYDPAAAVLAMALIAAAPLAIFIGAGDAAGERSRGTSAFLQALPVPLWRVALIKFGWGIATVCVPAVSVVVTLWAWMGCRQALGTDHSAPAWFRAPGPGDWSTGYWTFDVTLLIATISVSLYVWTLAGGARRSDEVSAGAFGLLLMVGWWFVLIIAAIFISGLAGNLAARSKLDSEWLFTLGAATAPAGFLVALEQKSVALFFGAMSVSLIVHTLLMYVYLRRFSAPPDLAERSPRTAARVRGRRDWLRPAFTTPRQAMIWKQTRESGPLAIVGGAAVMGIVAVVLSTWFIDRTQNSFITADDFIQLYGSTTLAVGMFIAQVAGIGVALNDTGAKISNFWRSRPVNPTVWFWTKYATGLLVVFLTLYVPLLVLVVILRPENLDPRSVETYWRSEIVLALSMQIALFSAALALTSLVRQAIYAAVLSIGAIYLGLVPAGIYWGNAIPESVMIVELLTVAAIATVVGWLAMRNDWGRRLL